MVPPIPLVPPHRGRSTRAPAQPLGGVDAITTGAADMGPRIAGIAGINTAARDLLLTLTSLRGRRRPPS